MVSMKRTRFAALLQLGLGGLSACSDAAAPGAPAELPRIEAERTFSDHREMDIRFEGADGAELEGTLYLPLTGGPFRTLVIQSGSSWTTRDTWDEVSFGVPALGAAFAYDRRGFGESGGACCPSDEDALYQLWAEDLVGAVEALAITDLVDADAVGLLGSSQGGWTVPLAATLARGAVRFTIVVVGGAISTGQEALYDQLTGYDVCERTSTSIEDINQALRDAGPSGFDPRASLEALDVPGLWMYGGLDWSHPAAFSTEVLQQVMSESARDWTVVTLPNANHELVDGGSICETGPPTIDALVNILGFLDGLP